MNRFPDIDAHSIPIDALVARTQSHAERGLTSAQAAEKLDAGGLNEPALPSTSWTRHLGPFLGAYPLARRHRRAAAGEEEKQL